MTQVVPFVTKLGYRIAIGLLGGWVLAAVACGRTNPAFRDAGQTSTGGSSATLSGSGGSQSTTPSSDGIDAGSVEDVGESGADRSFPASCGKALDFVRHDMALRNKVDDSQVVVVRAELTTWPDGCLGLPATGLCRLAPVEGCVLVVEANGRQLEYHITLEADSFGIANQEAGAD